MSEGNCTRRQSLTLPPPAAAERRWSARIPLAISVTLYDQGRCLGAVTSRDIGLEGMFVHAGLLVLDVHTLLGVEFGLPGDHRAQRYRLDALVVHVNAHGAGLMFASFQPRLFRRLQSMLYS